MNVLNGATALLDSKSAQAAGNLYIPYLNLLSQKREKGPRNQLFLKLFIDDNPNGASEPQEVIVVDDAQEEDPAKLKKKIDLLNAKVEAMGRTLAGARSQSTADRTEIIELQNQVQSYTQALREGSVRLQKALDDYNATAAQNRRLQNEYASAKLNLEHEKSANSRARLAFDTSISSRELSAQLALLAASGNHPPDYFQKLLEARNKAFTEANIRAHKAEVARATAEASAREESRKMKLQIEHMKAQMEEYQMQLRALKEQQQRQQRQQPSSTTTNANTTKRPAPPAWLLDAQTEAAAGIRPIAQPKKQLITSRTVGICGLATKANPRAGMELEAEIEGLIGPSSELPSMHPYAPIMPPPPAPQRGNIPAPMMESVPEPEPMVVVEAAAAEQPHVAGGEVIYKGAAAVPASDAGPGPNVAADGKSRSTLLAFRKRLLERKQAEAGGAPFKVTAAAPPPPALRTLPSAAVVDDINAPNSNPGPIEWGTEVENAAAIINEEEDVIELISDSEEEEEVLAAAPAAKPVEGVENDPRALNNNNNQHRRPLPSKATISFLAAGPSKIALASAPGTSFIRDPKFATTGLKDDATYIHSGPDGKGGRVTVYNGQQRNTNSNRAPAWGGTITDRVAGRGGDGGGGGDGNGFSKRVKGGSAASGSSKPINQYFGPKK
ncbi:hypothetical protein NADE_003243 [Nannochloris sp. 'desiccata']|nr:hypothetical protein NADE_003243 [Chlorella desiccata (nom. nud.)]